MSIVHHTFVVRFTLVAVVARVGTYSSVCRSCGINHASDTFRSYLITKRRLKASMSRNTKLKVAGIQLIKKFSSVHESGKFVTDSTTARHLFLPWARSRYVQWTSSYLLSVCSILILFSHLCICLPSDHFVPGFSTSTLQHFSSPPIRATCPAHLILSHLIINYVWW